MSLQNATRFHHVISSAPDARPSTFDAPRPRACSAPIKGGMAAHSDTMSSLQWDEVLPHILDDLENHQTCDVQSMIIEAIRRVLVDRGAKMEDVELVYRNCLELVLPYCNTQEDTGEKGSVAKEQYDASSSFRRNLLQYGGISLEEKRYEPLIRVLNTALSVTQKINIPGLRSAPGEDDPLQLIFHRNDPSNLVASHPTPNHLDRESVRRPDIVGVTYDSAIKANGMDTPKSAMFHDHAHVQAPKGLHGAGPGFGWEDPLASLEVKAQKQSLDSPPMIYSIKSRHDNLSIGTPSTSEKGSRHTKLPRRGRSLSVGTRRSGRVTRRRSITTEAIRSSVDLLSADERSAEATTPPNLHSFTDGGSAGDCVLPADVDVSSAPAISEGSTASAQAAGTQSARAKPMIGEFLRLETHKEAKALAQNAIYGTEMMCRAITQTHAWTMIIVDDKLHICYFDKENMIQTSALNFIQNLPYLLVLLLALQRFDMKDWGRGDFIKPDAMPEDGSKPQRGAFEFDECVVTVNMGKPIINRFSAFGRTTCILPVDEFRSETMKKPVYDMVLKLQWSEIKRRSEADILAEAHKVANSGRAGSVFIMGHIPQSAASRTLPGLRTSSIRERLGARPVNMARVTQPRECRAILMERLQPITELANKADLVRAFWDCFHCHFYLWEGGVYHQDISDGNLMCKIVNGEVRGVLIDFDLAYIGEDDVSRGQERTGTMLFMARDLLSSSGMQGKSDHLYRFDAESFIWVMIWIAGSYKNGKLVTSTKRLTKWWHRVRIQQCAQVRNDFLKDQDFVLEPEYAHDTHTGKLLFQLRWKLVAIDNEIRTQVARIREPKPIDIYAHIVAASPDEQLRSAALCPISRSPTPIIRANFEQPVSAEERIQLDLERQQRNMLDWSNKQKHRAYVCDLKGLGPLRKKHKWA